MTNVASFSLLTAFADDPFGGNPAAIVFLDPSLPTETLGKIAQNFNQPILVVVSPTSLPTEDGDPKVETRSIRFFTPIGGNKEPPICGHGLVAAAKTVFDLPEIIDAGKEVIRFKNRFGDTLEATKLDDGWIEIKIPSGVPGVLDEEDKKRLKGHVDKAFGRDVRVKDIKTGGSVYSYYVMTEIDENEDLAGAVLNADALLGNGYYVNVFTSSSPDPKYTFVSRMFAPGSLVDSEDHVCGTAHAILTPYWTSKLGLTPGKEISARQVSKRGGELRIVWEKDQGIIRLRGRCAIFGKGEIKVKL